MEKNINRIISFILILVVLLGCISPALMAPRAKAVAVADDAVLLAILLWFAGICGITFATSGEATTAMQGLFDSIGNTPLATQLDSLADDFKDGVLTLHASAKETYKSIVSSIKDFFKGATADDTGAMKGVVSVGATYGALNLGTDTTMRGYTYEDLRFRTSEIESFVVAVNGYEYVFEKQDGTNNGIPVKWFTCISSNCPTFTDHIGKAHVTHGVDYFDFAYYDSGDGITLATAHDTWHEDDYKIGRTSMNNRPWYWKKTDGFSITLTQIVDFNQSASVDGTGALQQFEILPDPDPDENPEEKPEIPVPIPLTPEISTIESGQSTGTDEDGNADKDKDPGIDPSQREQELKDFVANAQPKPEPEPDPEPSVDPSNPSEGDDKDKYQHNADWKSIFPFCVPFDLIEFLGVLSAEPEAPHFTWRIYAPGVVDYDLEIDLSAFDTVAAICRTLELLAFCVGLILLTRNIIRG